MLKGKASLLLAAAMLAAASTPVPLQAVPEPRRNRRPRILVGEYTGQQTDEVKAWNAGIEAKKAAKRERKQIRDANHD